MIATIGAVTALVGVGGAIRNDPVNGWRWIYYSLIIVGDVKVAEKLRLGRDRVVPLSVGMGSPGTDLVVLL